MFYCFPRLRWVHSSECHQRCGCCLKGCQPVPRLRQHKRLPLFRQLDLCPNHHGHPGTKALVCVERVGLSIRTEGLVLPSREHQCLPVRDGVFVVPPGCTQPLLSVAQRVPPLEDDSPHFLSPPERTTDGEQLDEDSLRETDNSLSLTKYSGVWGLGFGVWGLGFG